MSYDLLFPILSILTFCILCAEEYRLRNIKNELRKQHERFTLFLSTNDGMWDRDIRDNAVFLSPRYKLQLGYEDHELENSFESFVSRLHPEDRDRVLHEVQVHLTRRTPFLVEFRLRHKTGEYLWFETRGQGLWGAGGHPIRMAGSLRNITASKQIEERLREGATLLASATMQIMTSLKQLVTSTAQTATAVAQVAATVNEVKQTAYLARQKATEVSASAQQAVQVSQDGSQAIEASISGLNRVREQLHSIAESVVKLGKQSRDISDILTTVRGLAEQSNLLAVNAALEAARAGEQGKGFAVAAQEVRILANHSKEATAQIHAILNDIRKAGAVAVLVTEQGTKSAEAGVRQSLEAGESIMLLSANISDAAQIVSQIAASGQQQVAGMDQVAAAMEGLKTVSLHNADEMRRIESAAHNLNVVGKTLQQLVSQLTDRNGTDTQRVLA